MKQNKKCLEIKMNLYKCWTKNNRLDQQHTFGNIVEV